MYIKHLAIMAAFGAATVSAPALAQEEDGFSGLYVGGSFGGAFQSNDGGANVEFDTNLDGDFDNSVLTSSGAYAFAPGFCNGSARGARPTDGCKNDKDGIEYFGHVGFDRQMGSFVVGVVGEFGKMDVSDSISAFSTTPASYTLTREYKYNAGLRLRGGYTPNGQTLFYVTGGGAYAKIKNSFQTTNTANAFSDNGNSNAWGWSAGGGVEQKLGRNFSIGFQYLYTSIRDEDYVVSVSRGNAPATNPFLLVNPSGTDMRRGDEQFNTHSIRGTVSFRF